MPSPDPTPSRLPMRPIIRETSIIVALLALACVLALLAYRGQREVAFQMDAPRTWLPARGFHEAEVFTERPLPFRWTRGSGGLDLPNPGGPLIVRLLLTGGPRGEVPVELRTGDASAAFLVGPTLEAYSVVLPAQNGERVTLTIDSSAEELANRTLGVAVSSITIRGADGLPLQPLGALLVATIGVYALLRRAAVGILAAVSIVMLLQVLALVWQANNGWRYTFFGLVLGLAGAGALAAAVIERWLPPSAPRERARVKLVRADWIALGLIVLAALCVRLPWLAAPDPVGDLELSARRMEQLHLMGFAGSFTNAGDYMPLRLLWLRGLSELALLLGGTFRDPLPPQTLAMIKLPGMLADTITTGLLFVWARRWSSTGRAALLTLLYTLAPPVWMNVAWWGQVDATLMLPILLMLVLLERAGGLWSWAFWAVALLIKPQAIVFAPILYAATLRLHGSRGIARGGGLAGLLVALGCAPFALIGQGPGLMEAYLGSVDRFAQLTSRAYNLWYLATGGASGPDVGQGFGTLSFRLIGLLLLAVVVAGVCGVLLVRADARARTLGAGVIALAFFALPTQIHERYLFLSLPCFALALAAEWRLLPVYLLLVASATINILGTLPGFSPPLHALIAPSPLPLGVSALNLVLLVLALAFLLRSTWRRERSELPALPAI